MVFHPTGNGRIAFFHDDVLVELVSITFALGMILEKERLAAWGWASAGVMLFLAGSWAGMIEVWVSAVGMVAFVAPWFILGEDGESHSLSRNVALNRDWRYGLR